MHNTILEVQFICKAMQNYFTFKHFAYSQILLSLFGIRILETKIVIVVFVSQAGLLDCCFSES